MSNIVRASVRVTEGGRIVIPAEIRSRLHLEPGAELVMTVEDDHATLMNAKALRRKARETVRRYIKPAVQLSEELMSQRRQESARG